MSNGMKVTALVAGGHRIDDLRVFVPEGGEVTIPAEQVYRSKDLHRGLSQRQLFRLGTGPVQPPAPPAPRAEKQSAQARAATPSSESPRIRELERETEKLRSQVSDLKSTVEEKLDKVLGKLDGAAVAAPRGKTSQAKTRAAVEDDTPRFIPEQITPSDATVNVSVKEKSGDGDDVGKAKSALRRVRKKSRSV
jgi:hypothetical protein